MNRNLFLPYRFICDCQVQVLRRRRCEQWSYGFSSFGKFNVSQLICTVFCQSVLSVSYLDSLVQDGEQLRQSQLVNVVVSQLSCPLHWTLHFVVVNSYILGELFVYVSMFWDVSKFDTSVSHIICLRPLQNWVCYGFSWSWHSTA